MLCLDTVLAVEDAGDDDLLSLSFSVLLGRTNGGWTFESEDDDTWA